MKVKIKNAAIGAPIAAEVQDDALVSRGRCVEGGGQVDFRVTRSRVDVIFGGTRGNDGEHAGDQNGQNYRWPVWANARHAKPYLLTSALSTRRAAVQAAAMSLIKVWYDDGL